MKPSALYDFVWHVGQDVIYIYVLCPGHTMEVFIMLSILKEKVLENGVSWAMKSSKLMNYQLELAIKYHKQAQQYPIKNWYSVGEPRKELIEKRNHYLNQLLIELQKWGIGLNIPLLRPWQEKCDDIFSAALEFFKCEHIAIEHGLYRVG